MPLSRSLSSLRHNIPSTPQPTACRHSTAVVALFGSPSLTSLPSAPRHCTCVPCVRPFVLQIFAFLAFLIHIPLMFSRLAGFSFPLARDTQHSLYIELVLASIELFCFFLQTTIWGGTCFSPSRSRGSTTGVGYGLIIACFFFLIINEILYLLMRSNDDLVLGNGATRGGGGGAYGGDSGGYSGDAGGYSGGGSGDYGGGADNASQPTFSYQGSGETAGNSL